MDFAKMIFDQSKKLNAIHHMEAKNNAEFIQETEESTRNEYLEQEKDENDLTNGKN